MKARLFMTIFLVLLPIVTFTLPQAEANYRIVSSATDTWPSGSSNFALAVAVKVADVDGDSTAELVEVGTYYNGSSWAEARIYRKSSNSLVLEGSQIWSRPGATSAYLSAVETGDIDGDGLVEMTFVGNTAGVGQAQSHIGIYRWTGSSLVKERLFNFTGQSSTIETRGVAIWSNAGVNHIVTIGYYRHSSGSDYAQLGIWSWDNIVLTRKALWNWTGTGAGTTYAGGFDVATGDVDADGTADIVTIGYTNNGTTTSSQLRVWNWDGSSLNPKQTRDWLSFGQFSLGRSVWIGDLNGDGSLEIVAGGEDYDYPLTKADMTVWSDATGSLTQLSQTSWITSPTQTLDEHFRVSAGDVDGDGVREVVTAGFTNMPIASGPNGTNVHYSTIRVWSWSSNVLTVEKAYRSTTTDTRIAGFTLGDVDGDGKLDIATAGQRTGKGFVDVRNVALVYGSIAVTVSPSPSLAGQSVTVSGTLTNQTNGAALGSAQMVIEYSKDGGVFQIAASVVTDSQGRFATSFTPSGPGSYSVRATWAGDEEYMGASASAGLTVNKAPSVITLSSSTFTANPGETITVSGYLYPATSAAITITYNGPSGVVAHTVTSDSAGAFSDQSAVGAAGEWQVSASWAGSVDTASTASNTIRVQAQPEPIGVMLSPYGFIAALAALGVAVIGLMRKSKGSPGPVASAGAEPKK
jgi:hypothetical protein